MQLYELLIASLLVNCYHVHGHMFMELLTVVLVLSKTQRSTFVTGGYMITMMVLLCYVNLSGMSLECIVIVLMNNSLLGGQECTDSDNILQIGDDITGHNRLAIIPRLNFTCNGRITSIRARMWFEGFRSNYPFFQVWRAASVGSTTYNKIGEVQLQSDDQLTSVSFTTQIANITLTGNNTIEVQSGDVVGYYHPSNARFRVITRSTNGYILYQFLGAHESVESVDLNFTGNNNQQPVIQFTIGKCVFNYTVASILPRVVGVLRISYR